MAEQYGEMIPVHQSYYTSQDVGGDAATWTVYGELMPDDDEREPIDGSQRVVCAGLSSEAVADNLAHELYRMVNR